MMAGVVEQWVTLGCGWRDGTTLMAGRFAFNQSAAFSFNTLCSTAYQTMIDAKGGVHCWSNVGADLVCSKGFKPLPKQFDHNYTTFNSLLTNQTTILCLLYPAMPPIFQHLHFILSFYAKAKVIVCRFISANWLKAIND